MADCEVKDTSSQPPKQMSHEEIVAGIKKVIAVQFTDRELTELKSYVTGLLQVSREK